MQDQRAVREALMLPPESESELDRIGFGDPGARITPLAAPPDWLRNFGREARAVDSAEPKGIEEEFWSGPPRYSITGVASLLPLANPRPPSRLRVWAARLLFAALFGGVIALLACELSRIVHP